MSFRPHGIRQVMPVVIAIAAIAAVACGSDIDLDGTIDARVQQALEARPTTTPQPTSSPQPTSTTQIIPTPLPTATPATTATPPPTPTPPPAPTPVPTATPQPTSTPAPTATPHAPAPPTPTPIAIPADLYSDVRLSVVKIRNGTSTGSGWAIEDGWIITNEHVIFGAGTVTVEVPRASGGVDILTGTVRGYDKKRDLAAVEVDHNAPVLPRRVIVAHDAGTPIIQLGYSVGSTGGFPVIHSGVVTTVIRHLGTVLESSTQRADEGGDTAGVSVIIFDADADPGDSGGPVLDMQGNVVGTTFGAVVFTSGGKRVIGQQQATGIESTDRVWTQLKNGVITSTLGTD